MKMTKDQHGDPVAIPQFQDLALMVKALECYSRELDSPEQEAEMYHCDALRSTFAFWLVSLELEFRTQLSDIEEARDAFDEKTRREAA